MGNETLPRLRPSAISGLVRLRAKLRDEPGLSLETACKLLRTTYDGGGLDLQHACILHGFIASEVVDRQSLYRHAIRLVATQNSPPWLALLRLGRDALLAGDPDLLTCFQRAGVFDAMPAPGIIEWWDELASLAYANVDVTRMTIGRHAERLSLEYERSRLVDKQGAPPITWKSLDSNIAGYDIHSWQFCEGQWMPKYIEVKGSQWDPPRLHLTRHEWDVATRHGAAYTFHIWDITRARMTELSVAWMASHVPIDSGHGTWREVRIELPDHAFEHSLTP